MVLEREAGSAAARSGGVRIIDLERRSDQVVDKFDLRAGHIVERDGVDQDGGAGALDDDVVLGLGALGVELVLKSGASAAGNAHPQHRAGGLQTEDFTNPDRRPFGNRDASGHIMSSSRTRLFRFYQPNR